LEEISFEASDLGAKDEAVIIDKSFVNEHLSELAQDEDLSRFIL
jgi:ATP-dependent HslUV protease ATP-binding subunit HslU